MDMAVSVLRHATHWCIVCIAVSCWRPALCLVCMMFSVHRCFPTAVLVVNQQYCSIISCG